MRPFCLLVSVSALCACQPAGVQAESAPDTFDFATVSSVTLDVRVQKAGNPLQGASVDISAVYAGVEGDSEQEARGETYFQGGTDAFGRCRATVPLPAAVQQVDVVVHHAGSIGSYTDEELRAKWGPFAPSARQTVAVEDLSSWTIELEDL